MIIVGLPLIMVILRAHDLKRFPNVIFQLLVPTTLSSAESEWYRICRDNVGIVEDI